MYPPKEKNSDWKDFPKGLNVLVVDEDAKALSEISQKLRSYHFTVTTICKVDDAVAAIKSLGNIFHVALVEANIKKDLNGFKILEATRSLPIVMTIESENIGIMMRGIALGAADFWIKPLSEEKLRNIWQHVIRKVVNSEDGMMFASFKSVRAALNYVLHSTSLWGTPKIESSGNDVRLVALADSGKKIVVSEEGPHEAVRVKFSSPSKIHREASRTSPDLEEVAPCDQNPRPKDEQEDLLSNSLESVGMCLTYIKSEDHKARTKIEFDENMDDLTISTGSAVYGGNANEVELDACLPSPFSTSAEDINLNESLGSGEVHDEDSNLEEHMMLAQASRVADNSSANVFGVPAFNFDSKRSYTDDKNDENATEQVDQRKNSIPAKRKKVQWTPELHRLFVQAVEQLGVKKAIPSRILELMGVKCLTRHNIASHLQKYRSHRKHFHVGRDADTIWTQRRFSETSSLSKPKLGSSQGNPLPIQPRLPPGYPFISQGNLFIAPLHVWGHPVVDQSSGHMLHQPVLGTSSTWQAADGSYLQQPVICAPGQPYYLPAMRLLPALQPAGGKVPTPPLTGDLKIPNVSAYSATEFDGATDCKAVSVGNMKPSVFHPSKAILDATISEALSNPSLPLPLGLKSPSIESVMAELQRQGIDKWTAI